MFSPEKRALKGFLMAGLLQNLCSSMDSLQVFLQGSLLRGTLELVERGPWVEGEEPTQAAGSCLVLLL